MLSEPRPLGPDALGYWVRWWMSAGWEREVDGWVEGRMREVGRRVVGAGVTYRARFWSVVRCYRVDDGLVWFKENNPGQRFEAGLVAELARVVPDDVIVPIAVDRERGWLLTEDCGTTLSHADVADQGTRLVVVRALARLQCAVLGKIEPGVITLAPETAGDRIREVAAEWAELPAGHPLRIGPELAARARVAADVLDRRTAALSATVPLDVEFNDVYPANIFADRSTGVLRPRFFDFGNTLRAHPFVTLHGFLDSVADWTRSPLSLEHREELYAAYLAIWSNHLAADPAVLRQDLDGTKPLVDVHRLISWQRLIPYADPLELRARAEIPRRYLESSVGAIQG